MLKLSVNLDTSFIELLNKSGSQISRKEWEDFCIDNDIEDLKDYTLFDYENQKISKGEINQLNNTVDYLTNNLGESVKHISKVFPDTPNNITHDLSISLLPYGRANFGPIPSMQLFSLKPHADPYETYLFLIHIYYHEISFINYTKYCEECSNNPNTSDKLKYYILILIQNEGIGNYAVLDSLSKFRNENPDYNFQYFTYAEYLSNQIKVGQSMSLLRQMFNELNDENFLEYKKKINLVLKNKHLPIINLVGTYMAEVIVNNYGINALKNVYKKSPIEFFKLYLSTDDQLKKHLIPNNESLNYFNNLTRK